MLLLAFPRKAKSHYKNDVILLESFSFIQHFQISHKSKFLQQTNEECWKKWEGLKDGPCVFQTKTSMLDDGVYTMLD